jgi:UPF0271 protein
MDERAFLRTMLLNLKVIDLNADLGEGMSTDAEMFGLVTSANIACGGHAGSFKTIVDALTFAKNRGVKVGAHPGYADPANFGRLERAVTDDVLENLRLQVEAVLLAAQELGVLVGYLKPHGALYNQACRDAQIARAIVDLAMEFNLALLALPNSELEKASEGKIPFFREGFADRRYDKRGLLLPRSRPDAFVHDPSEAFDQALRLIEESSIRSLCVHGDNPKAVEFAQQLRFRFEEAGFKVRSFME